MPRTRIRKEFGYEVCAHICPRRKCVSPLTQTILWNKEGSSCQRHCGSALKHPDCISSGICPQSVCLGRRFTENSQGVRNPTDEELSLLPLSPSRTPSPSDVEMDYTPTTTIVPTANTDRVFQILFVLDPTTCVVSKAAATNDLAFVTTTISKKEYDTVSHLDGFIHNIKNHKTRYGVCIQEWVCILS
jgi:hypothetical protein